MSWAMEEKCYSQRRACALVGIAPRVYRYQSSRPDDGELRQRLKELSSERRRFGYPLADRRLHAIAERRRLHLLLKREGVEVNWKKLYRIDGLTPNEFATRFQMDHNVNRASL